MLETNLIKDKAFEYLNKGFSIIPLDGKRPLISWEEFQKRHATPEEVDRWFTKWPNANIGIMTGKISGVTVLDIDAKNNVNGFHTLEMLGITLPDTVCVNTPSGGRHYYFKYTDKIQNTTGTIGVGLDTKNDGGMIVLPPSLIDGKPYEFLACQGFGEIELAEFPKELLNLVSAKNNKPYELPKQILNGHRNDHLFKYACVLRAKGMEQEEIHAAVSIVNKKRCAEPLKETELATLVKQSCKYDDDTVGFEVIEDRKEPEVNEKKFLTLDSLPDGWLKDYVKFAYPLTEAPLQFHIATGLVILSTALGRNVSMQEGASYYYPNLYVVVIGKSGSSRKSTASSMACKFLNKLNPSTVLGCSGSLEAIQEAFTNNYCHCIVYDELRMIIDNENKSYGAGMITFLTSLWSGPDQIRIDRKNIKEEKDRILNTPTMNLLCSTTPEYMNLKEMDVSGGFLGRFLPICADDSDTRLLAIRPPIDTTAFDSLYTRLDNIRYKKDAVYTWTDEAKEIFEGLYKELHDDFKLEKDERIGSYWSRIDTHIRKLCMIFDIASDRPTYTITRDNLLRAYAIMKVVTDYYREMLSGLTFSWAEKMEKKITDELRKACPKGIRHADIMRKFRLDSKNMAVLTNSLIEKQIIHEVEEKLTKKKAKVYYFGE